MPRKSPLTILVLLLTFMFGATCHELFAPNTDPLPRLKLCELSTRSSAPCPSIGGAAQEFIPVGMFARTIPIAIGEN
jgi:hypothetical protein